MLAPEKLLVELASVPTGNIADAMSKLGIQGGIVDGLRPLSPSQPPVAGYALTIKQMQRHSSKTESILARHSAVIDEQTESSSLIVIDAGGRTDVCTGGSMLMLRAKLLGAKGCLINGCLRDVAEIAALEFPVYYIRPCPRKSSPELQTVAVNEPVEIGGVQICKGDIVVMDDTGVIVIPAIKGEEVLLEAQKIKKKETLWVELLKEGKTFAEARQICAETFG